MVNLVTTEPVEKEFKPIALNLAEEIPQIVSVINSLNNRKAQIAFADEEILIYGKKSITDKIGNLSFEISANSFFQTNTLQAERLYETVADFAGLSGKETVFDLYSGTGTIAIFLAARAKKVIGVEILEDAVTNARKNADDNGVENCEFHQGDMKEALKLFAGHSPDVLVVDPPRAGLHGKALEDIITLAPRKIVYVSCNPSTLARDLELMKKFYALKRAKPVDMFPHTWHIETVTLLERIDAEKDI
jgi:23S rRNA (uracil1939-C5)-methyltransferase